MPKSGFTSLLIALISVQAGAALAKQLFPLVGVTGASVCRLALAAFILCGIWRPWRKKLSRGEARSILAYGISLGAMNIFFYQAIARIPLGIAVAIEFIGPLAVALLASRRPHDFLWAALAVAGIVLVLPLAPASVPLDPIGIFYAVGAGVGWGFYIIWGQRAGAKTHGGTVAALGIAVAALMVLPFGIAQIGWGLLNPTILPLALGVAVLSSALPYSLEMLALKKIPAKKFGILMSLEPALAAASGLLFLNEHLSVIQWLAILCIIVASIGSSASK